MRGRGKLVMGMVLAGLVAAMALLPACSDKGSTSSPKPDANKTADAKAQADPKTPAAETPKEQPKEQAPPVSNEKLVPLQYKMPDEVFNTTPKAVPPSEHLEPDSNEQPSPLMVPEGCVNLALGKPVTSSDTMPIIGEMKQVTDGEKDGRDGSWVEVMPGNQWVQIDLGASYPIYAIVIWHYHGEKRVYSDVVVRIGDDPDFVKDPVTVFNNDWDNSAGLGAGKDLEYREKYWGKAIQVKNAKGTPGVTGRYVRLYSNGNTSNEVNHYIEVEVYGKPTK
jgi:hypothetical protein